MSRENKGDEVHLIVLKEYIQEISNLLKELDKSDLKTYNTKEKLDEVEHLLDQAETILALIKSDKYKSTYRPQIKKLRDNYEHMLLITNPKKAPVISDTDSSTQIMDGTKMLQDSLA